MARFRPLRWIAETVRKVFVPEPPPAPRPRPARPAPTPRPTVRPTPAARPPVRPVRAPEPRAEPVSRFYTRDAPDELTGDYTVNQLVETAYFDRDISSDQRAEFRQALRDYVEAEYDIRWDDYFDWEAWRAEMGY